MSKTEEKQETTNENNEETQLTQSKEQNGAGQDVPKVQEQDLNSDQESHQQDTSKPTKGTDSQFNRLGTAKVSSLLKEFAIPAIVSMIVSGTYNILSAVFLGWGVGDQGLAVATVANPMMILFVSVAMLVGNGGNALAAIRLGEGKKEEAERVLGNTFALAIIGAAVLAALAWFAIDPILSISGATQEIWEMSKLFIRILASGCVFQIVGMGINNFIRSAGDPNRALWSMLVGTLVTLTLSSIFVLVFRWGVAGQAAATILGQGVSCFVILYYFVASPKSPFKLRAANIPFCPHVPTRIIALGSAPFLLNVAMAVVSIVLNNQVATYGAMSSIGETGSFAMFAVIQRVAMFVMFPVTGIGVAAQPLLGFNYGAGIPQRVKETLTLELKAGVIICISMWILIELFAPTFCTWFGVSAGVLEYTQFALRLQTMFMPIMTFQIVIGSYFQSTGRPVRSAFLSLTRQIIYLIPLYVFMPIVVGIVSPSTDQLIGILLSPPIADILSFITAMIFVVREYRSLNKAIKAKESGEECSWGAHF